MVSPYLLRPLRTEAEARRDIEAARQIYMIRRQSQMGTAVLIAEIVVSAAAVWLLVFGLDGLVTP